jgi:Icc protein
MTAMLIAQISDFHIKTSGALAYGAADTQRTLEVTIAHLNRLRPPPDVVLVTGDLSDDGSAGSYQTVKAAMARLTLPFYLVPGNHDQKDRLAAAFPGHPYLDARVDDSGHGTVCYVVEQYPLRLIGMDTVTPGAHGGGLGKGRLAWLDRTLARRPDTPALVFMHHPPFPAAIGHMDTEPFANRRRLADLFKRHSQVQRIACGHIHRAITTRFGGVAATVCPGVGMQLALELTPEAPSRFVLEPPAVLLHQTCGQWGRERLLTHVSLVPDPIDRFGRPHPFYDVVSPV